MQRTLSLIGSVLLVSLTGFSEILITADDHAVDSDVVLESAVQDVKSIPRDTADVVGDSVKYVADEITTAAGAVASVFGKDVHGEVKNAADMATAEAWDGSDDILFRSYAVSEQIGSVLMSVTNDTAASGESPFIDVSKFFTGVDFPKKASATYLPKNRTLFVRQTSANLAAIEDVLDGYKSAQRDLMGQQVEIEAKFVEVGQKTLNELGFNWTVGSDLNVLNGGTDLLSSGLRTASQAMNAGTAGSLLVSKTAGTMRWDLMISALEQSDDADVLSAPRVVTRSGSTATIEVGEEQVLPKSFDVDNRSSSPWVIPSDWNNELLGVKLEVTPQLREDGLIDLRIAPEVKDIVGFESYEVVPRYTSSGRVSNIQVNGSLPYYRLRKMDTKVTVADGSTVGMGGLIYDKLETFKDKVPVLGSIPLVGRLFRSEGERSVKRNLMVFVTATQVDVKGRRASDLALEK